LGYLTSYIHAGTISVLTLDAAEMFWSGISPINPRRPWTNLAAIQQELSDLSSTTAFVFSH
jgi:hypothetical protein